MRWRWLMPRSQKYRDRPMSTTIPILHRRHIEADLIRLFYEELIPRIGKTEAQAVIREVVRASAIKQARQFAKSEPNGTSLQSFIDIQKHWTAENALEIEVTRRDPEHIEFNVTRCRYAEMYREMGLGEIGHLLSCNRDGAFSEGYDEKLEFRRTQTIMQGASHCDFKYRYPVPEKT
jgi:predicted hydrocarbon binding protein